MSRPNPFEATVRDFAKILALGSGLFLACPAAAQTPQAPQGASAAASASAQIDSPASVAVVQNLTFTVPAQALGSGIAVTSSAVNGVNANVVLTGGQTASVSVPATFDVVRTGGGGQTITVRTVGPVTNVANNGSQVVGVANGGVFSNPVTVVGAIDNGVLSFSVGGEVTLANNLVPGEYQGVLTVIAQYN